MNRVPIAPRKRYKILQRDNFMCCKCGKTSKEVQLEVDHIIPISNGGTNDESNLQTLCVDCNMGKFNIIDESFAKYNEERKKIELLNPIDKLSLIKEKIKPYLDFEWSDVKFILYYDLQIRILRPDMRDIKDIFISLKNKSKVDMSNNETNKKNNFGEGLKFGRTSMLTWLNKRGLLRKGWEVMLAEAEGLTQQAISIRLKRFDEHYGDLIESKVRDVSGDIQYNNMGDNDDFDQNERELPHSAI